MENYYGALTGGGIGYDDVLFPEMIKLYEVHKESDGRPYFSFNVTYQGHGPYDTDVTWYGDGWVVDDGSYTQEELNLMNNYFGSLKNTGDNLEMFFDYFRESKMHRCNRGYPKILSIVMICRASSMVHLKPSALRPDSTAC